METTVLYQASEKERGYCIKDGEGSHEINQIYFYKTGKGEFAVTLPYIELVTIKNGEIFYDHEVLPYFVINNGLKKALKLNFDRKDSYWLAERKCWRYNLYININDLTDFKEVGEFLYTHKRANPRILAQVYSFKQNQETITFIGGTRVLHPKEKIKNNYKTV